MFSEIYTKIPEICTFCDICTQFHEIRTKFYQILRIGGFKFHDFVCVSVVDGEGELINATHL